MALSDTQTLDDASGDDVAYVLLGRGETSAVRMDSASTPAEPGKLAIRHSLQGSGVSAIDRHLVQFTRTVDNDPGPITITANFTLAVPRHESVTNQIVYDLVANLVDFLSAGGMATLTTTTIEALLRGES